MSLYNMLFGSASEDRRNFLFGLLGKTSADFGRFRDIYVADEFIVVYTRNGGGNREDYEHVFEEMSNHHLYVNDEDDDFDCTYASIYFRHPPEYTEVLKEMAKGTITPSEKWQLFFDAMEKKD